ncbi:DNA-binding CsgD family transcriptional regulator [Conyzicola lurida]|uniref:DNA-binding CsgD family transcriptional regulator n=1 Tax=Conyzicola lurida TaxID=1172621 RepID=A0A841AR92_9MICO|nr:helix-turn-helix transcriptional regulator [Conyzicola lurida]MBB5844452.1 DNA-binding CsgD family transcriptional regulator [Conyzicola lurida]
MGKSFVASTLVERIEPGMHEANDNSVIRCTRSRDVARLLRLQGDHGESRGIVTIEDAHVLSLENLQGLVDFVGSTDRPVLITLDINPVGPATAESVARTRTITSLWADLGLERVDLSGVGFTEASAMIDDACGHEGLDVVTRARIVHGAAGNPKLIGELTREALRNPGSVDMGSASLILGPNTLPPRILDLARERLLDLSDVDEYALITLAKLGTIPYVRAARLVGQAPLRSLLRRGLVSHEPGASEFVAANLLYASAAQLLREVENPLDAEHAVEKLLLSDLRMGESLTSSECVVLSTYWVNNPDADPLDGLSAEKSASVLCRAARRADVWGLPAASEVFARRSMALAPAVPAVHSLSRALAGQGRVNAALDLLERDTTPHTVPREDVDLAMWWILLSGWVPDSEQRRGTMVGITTGWGTVDPLLAAIGELTEMFGELISSDYEDGIDALNAFAADESKPMPLRLRALTLLVSTYSHRGEPAELDRAYTDGRALVGEIAASRSFRTYSDDHTAAAIFIARAGFTLSQQGESRVQLSHDLDVYALRAVLEGNELELALVNAVSGSLSLSSQNAARAEVELARAEAGLRFKTEPETSFVVRLLRAVSLFALNRPDEAMEIFGSMSPAELTSEPWMEFYSRYIRILLDVNPADMTKTHAALLDLADYKKGRYRQVSMTGAYLASRAGAPLDKLVALMDGFESLGHSHIADVYEEHVRAEAAGDAFRLDAVGSRLEEFGLSEEAAWAFSLAMTAHLGHGRSAEAVVSRARRDAQARQPLSPVTAVVPASNAAARDNVARLTRRELEIAQLAGIGLSNSEIASRLFLSVRTVESHVLQARVKLGASRRSELGLYLADVGSKVS